MSLLRDKFLNWYDKGQIEQKQSSCEHKEWDMDTQIRVIKCRECGKTAVLQKN
jgi:hypothetical protein